MVAVVIDALARQGHPGVTATHEFAIQAIDRGAIDASALARDLGVSRQAAAKTVAALEELGYVQRAADAGDARRKRLRVTRRGHQMGALGGAAFNELRERLRTDVGAQNLAAVEDALRRLSALDAGA